MFDLTGCKKDNTCDSPATKADINSLQINIAFGNIVPVVLITTILWYVVNKR